MTSKQILVLESDLAMAELLDHVLTAAGYSVTIQQKCDGLGKSFRAFEPSLVIVHTSSSSSRASSLAGELEWHDTLPEVSLLVLSSHVDPNSVVWQRQKPHPVVILGMPFDIECLVSTVEKIVAPLQIPSHNGRHFNRPLPGEEMAFA